MAENARTGFVWETFMKNPEAIRGMQRAGFKTYQPQGNQKPGLPSSAGSPGEFGRRFANWLEIRRGHLMLRGVEDVSRGGRGYRRNWCRVSETFVSGTAFPAARRAEVFTVARIFSSLPNTALRSTGVISSTLQSPSVPIPRRKFVASPVAEDVIVLCVGLFHHGSRRSFRLRGTQWRQLYLLDLCCEI